LRRRATGAEPGGPLRPAHLSTKPPARGLPRALPTLAGVVPGLVDRGNPAC